ncbi:MAG TPA: cytochrome C oxidase subunit IV family protein [Bacilli bacterium]
MSAEQAKSQEIKGRPVHEGPRNHLLAFLISIILTALAFLTVIYADYLDSFFVWGFLIILAVFQAGIQAIFWMHLKDRGNLHQRIFIVGGAFIAFTVILAGVYWVWW